jgi:hypothetical protein
MEILRNVFLIVFLILVVTIILTPILVSRGLFGFTEEAFEAVLLFVQVSVAWNVFRQYEKTVKRQEEETRKLEIEYEIKEKELLEAFKHLGKINVQISLVKSFLQKLKAPTSKKEMKQYIDEILRIALSLARKQWIALKMINPENLNTVSEHWAQVSPNTKVDDIKIGNKDIIDLADKNDICNKDGYCVITSEGDGTAPLRAYLVFLENKKIDPEIRDFLEAAANQCELLYALYSLKYKKDNGKSVIFGP